LVATGLLTCARFCGTAPEAPEESSGGFPNRRTKLPGNLALILQDLSLTAFTFPELQCTKNAPGNFRICGKLLKVNAGEVAERLNAAVC
jgi:hypothetical protein